jgi:hypothetical protein
MEVILITWNSCRILIECRSVLGMLIPQDRRDSCGFIYPTLQELEFTGMI